ncbi:MAG TPA: serine/threonine-protein kinase [Planctomycetota bacterium]|nr:serine/threonine-protein kinase [Planctomycetota bacterium]
MSCPRCGSSGTERLSLCPGCLLDGDVEPVVLGGTLELLEELGRGGMGAVYKARHLRLGRMVAVKLLPPALASDPEAEARFEREARALALLSHPHIVAVHDFGREDGQSWLVMEHVDGPSFPAALPLPPERALELGLQICDAVAFAHRQGIVHRDLKPENVLLDASGRAKVADFGIARILRPEVPKLTSTSVALGTPRYMAPEALEGAPPDPRMDVYALGVLLYKMVMGVEPSGVFPPAPAPFDAAIRRALSSDPALRFKDAGEMRDALAAGVRAGPFDRRPEERSFLRGVAILQSISTAVALWAFLVCMTPKTFAAGELLPLVSLGSRTLPDGRIHSPVRFETGWILAALATFAGAVVAYGLLRRHWRISGLEENAPERPLPDATRVFWAGAVALAVYGVRRALEAAGQDWAVRYIPLLGGFILVAALYFFWCAVLEGWRTSRPLRREPLLWLGAGLAVFAPVVEFLRALR